jgi:hypothetical protein
MLSVNTYFVVLCNHDPRESILNFKNEVKTILVIRSFDIHGQ